MLTGKQEETFHFSQIMQQQPNGSTRICATLEGGADPSRTNQSGAALHCPENVAWIWQKCWIPSPSPAPCLLIYNPTHHPPSLHPEMPAVCLLPTLHCPPVPCWLISASITYWHAGPAVVQGGQDNTLYLDTFFSIYCISVGPSGQVGIHS